MEPWYRFEPTPIVINQQTRGGTSTQLSDLCGRVIDAYTNMPIGAVIYQSDARFHAHAFFPENPGGDGGDGEIEGDWGPRADPCGPSRTGDLGAVLETVRLGRARTPIPVAVPKGWLASGRDDHWSSSAARPTEPLTEGDKSGRGRASAPEMVQPSSSTPPTRQAWRASRRMPSCGMPKPRPVHPAVNLDALARRAIARLVLAAGTEGGGSTCRRSANRPRPRTSGR